MLPHLEETHGVQMRVFEHFIQRVGAHDGNAVLFAELHPRVCRVGQRCFAQHLVIDEHFSLALGVYEALALIGARNSAQLQELGCCHPADRLDGDMPVLRLQRPTVVGKGRRVADMADMRLEGRAIKVLGQQEAGEAFEHGDFDELAFARSLAMK